MTEAQITGVLRTRHDDTKWTFVPQCKMGSTFGSTISGEDEDRLRIIDAFAIKKAWTNLETVGYEIKRSRKDFQNDTKWRAYLKACALFWFVVTEEMFEADEPWFYEREGCGLLVCSEDGSLRVARKAPRRVPREGAVLDVLRYIVYWRMGA